MVIIDNFLESVGWFNWCIFINKLFVLVLSSLLGIKVVFGEYLLSGFFFLGLELDVVGLFGKYFELVVLNDCLVNVEIFVYLLDD